MRILSIQLGHNATVALAEDGRIAGVLSQEKLDNIKNSAAFPADAIRALAVEVGWSLNSVDQVVIATNEVFAPDAFSYVFDAKQRAKDRSQILRIAKRLESSPLGITARPIFRYLRVKRHEALHRDGKRHLTGELTKLGLDRKPVRHVEHHTCHARAAYHSFVEADDHRPALVFTADGMGDGLSATVSVVRNSRWDRIAETPIDASLGMIYSGTTRFLGMKVLEHEYKVMGLAPYAKGYFLETYRRVFEPVIWLQQVGLVFQSAFPTTRFYDYLVENAVGERFDNLAAAVQHLLEQLVVEWVRRAIRQTGIRRIFTGGGLFMNVKLNRMLQELEEVEEACFMPSCGDESNPIGAAYAVFAEGMKPTYPLRDIYLGISYEDKALGDFVEQRGLRGRCRVERPADIEEAIAELLAKREVVARFAGRCEWGARSLGNRAILAHPSHMESFYTVNDLIKARDFWMPFAPSILDTSAEKYLRGYDPKRVQAPYMITAYAATDRGVKELRAAMHQGDHTLRPQVVTSQANPEFYRLIQAFEGKTGVGAVLNTSFNLHGYPLVATPEQALMTFDNSGLQHLALGNYLISKR